MSRAAESTFRVGVDPTNPGQFFACCGLLELADRLWGGVEGWFEQQGSRFCLNPLQAIPDPSSVTLINKLAGCSLTNTMTESQLRRRDELSSMTKKERESQGFEEEKKALDAIWREAPLVLHAPFHLRLDWFLDDRSGGSMFKTWAGQQSVIDIALGMQASVAAIDWATISSDLWLSRTAESASLPFYFDSTLGGTGSDLDVGFSFDPLKIGAQCRPLLELAAFVGLQRFRSIRIARENRYQFAIWTERLVPQVAAATASGLLGTPGTRQFEFRLLYRTKYLKSFLPANPLGGDV